MIAQTDEIVVTDGDASLAGEPDFDPRLALRAYEGKRLAGVLRLDPVCDSLNVPMGEVIRDAERAEYASTRLQSELTRF